MPLEFKPTPLPMPQPNLAREDSDMTLPISPDSGSTNLPPDFRALLSEQLEVLKSFTEKQTRFLESQYSHKKPKKEVRPYDQGNPKDWAGWKAMLESSLAKTRQRAEVWTTGMDVTLVFVGYTRLLEKNERFTVKQR
ncbi:hypothetical protein SISSUDRAFT_87952 [Sistotremastrum suecicum HHB10207 ss-3]|uniref:Uncharacterized protein n=1 Tax=Sistotremastrum suecicum HHB10207 ss-3 TaxID=1314776 RepID=A0A166BC01_9AGAM|nr:hypothetical protein SISSUDRAFT_87952 [Sistotremastrum suecicum HHB10207 ss-3]